MKKKKFTGFLQSAVLILLFLALLGQCAFYISFAENMGSTTLEAFPDSEIKLLSGLGTGTASSRLISPCFVAVIGENAGGKGVALPLSHKTEGNAGYEVWQQFVTVIENSAKGTAKQVNFSGNDEKAAYLAQLYENSKGCYYARFTDGLEFSVLTSLLQGSFDVIPENPDFIISDMFLICGANGEASITATAPDGEVLKIFPSRNITFNNEILHAYNNTEEGSFEFRNIAEGREYDHNGYYPVLLRSYSANSLVRSDFDSFFTITEESQDARNIAEMFGMNINNTRTYTTNEGDVVFVEDTNRLRITQKGEAEYIPDGNGTPASDILGKDGTGFDAVAEASQSIAVSLSEKLSLCDATLNLKGISFDGEISRFVYRYSANGIPIVDNGYEGEDDNALILDFFGDRLVSAKMNIIPYRFSGVTVTDMPQKSALALLLKDSENQLYDGKVTYFGAQYTFGENEDEARLVFSLKVEREAEG